MAKTTKYRPLVKKVVHPKKYTDPLDDQDELSNYIEEELSTEELLDDEVVW